MNSLILIHPEMQTKIVFDDRARTHNKNTFMTFIRECPQGGYGVLDTST
jgi:hypothetical protein